MATKRAKTGGQDFAKPLVPNEAAPQHWEEHEHLTPPVEAQAKRLVEEAGSKERAKHAVDAAGDAAPLAMQAADKDQFARQLGFTSYLDLFEASTRESSADGGSWFTTAVRGGGWVAWNDVDLTASQRVATIEEARRQVPHAPEKPVKEQPRDQA